jgi:hypothetical protein
VQTHSQPASYLRVIFPPPGFFVIDARVALSVNRYPVFEGTFTQGFDWWTAMPPGVHLAEARIVTPLGLSRSKTFSLEVRHGLTTIARIEYSRIWGNFGATPSVSFVPP